jgi:hypothetical protein
LLTLNQNIQNVGILKNKESNTDNILSIISDLQILLFLQKKKKIFLVVDYKVKEKKCNLFFRTLYL